MPALATAHVGSDWLSSTLSVALRHAVFYFTPDAALHTSSLEPRTTTSQNSGTTGLGGKLEDPDALLQAHERLIIDILALVAASLSIIGCVVVVYWFFMMKRNFRRTSVSKFKTPGTRCLLSTAGSC